MSMKVTFQREITKNFVDLEVGDYFQIVGPQEWHFGDEVDPSHLFRKIKDIEVLEDNREDINVKNAIDTADTNVVYIELDKEVKPFKPQELVLAPVTTLE